MQTLTRFLTLFLSLCVSPASSQLSGYQQKLRDLSFDMSLMREYPVEWQTTGSAVPILSKIKMLPNIPKVNGQLFLKNALATPAWSVSYRLSFEMDSELNKLKQDEMADLFAMWFLMTEPKIREGTIEHEKVFGFRDKFNGIGMFVYKIGDAYRMQVMENPGTEQVSLKKLSKKFNNGVNGCVIDPLNVATREFIATVKAE